MCLSNALILVTYYSHFCSFALLIVLLMGSRQQAAGSRQQTADSRHQLPMLCFPCCLCVCVCVYVKCQGEGREGRDGAAGFVPQHSHKVAITFAKTGR